MVLFRDILIGHAVVTSAMAGVILVVQVVHYPLFARVGHAAFAEYERQHARRITWVVGPLMIVELASAISLIVLRPDEFPTTLLWVGLGLLAVIWISTATIQVPMHRRLASGFSEVAHRTLVRTNWIRAIGWVARAIAAAILLVQYYTMTQHVA